MSADKSLEKNVFERTTRFFGETTLNDAISFEVKYFKALMLFFSVRL